MPLIRLRFLGDPPFCDGITVLAHPVVEKIEVNSGEKCGKPG